MTPNLFHYSVTIKKYNYISAPRKLKAIRIIFHINELCGIPVFQFVPLQYHQRSDHRMSFGKMPYAYNIIVRNKLAAYQREKQNLIYIIVILITDIYNTNEIQ